MKRLDLILKDENDCYNIKCRDIKIDLSKNSIHANVRGSRQPHSFILGHMNEYKPISFDLIFENGNVLSGNNFYIISFVNYILEIHNIVKL